jgi:DNA-binding transcriptional LysR family regulator
MLAAELPLGAALGRMASANSRLRVHHETGDFEHLAREVLGGRIEFAVADTTSAERHPTRLAIEPVAEHRVFFYVRQGHPLATAKEHSLETILVFPLVGPRLPQRIAGHFGKLAATARIDRDTGDLTPNLMVNNFSVALKTVLGGDAVGLAPLVALETDLRARRIALLPFTAPWLHLSYGLFYTRKRSLSRVAQLFMTQLRRVEADLQAREQRALLRLEGPRRRARKKTARRTASAEGAVSPAASVESSNVPAAVARSRRTRKPRT